MLLAGLLVFSIAQPTVDAGVELRISRAADTDGYPSFSVELVNRTRRAWTLVRPGDGSDDGWRTPIIGWSLEPLNDAAVLAMIARHNTIGCGSMNRIQANEVFTLAPGATADISNWIQPRLPPGGRYRMSLSYENRPTHEPDKEFHQQDPEVVKLLRATDKLVISSNVIEVDLSVPRPSASDAPESKRP